MKKILMTLVVSSFGLVGTLTFWANDADAIPVFARKYGMACNSCHTMFPKLSKMGVAFRERGFRFAAGKDDQDSQDDRGKNFDTGDESPAAVFASSFPFTVRTQIVYSGAGPITDGLDTPVMPGHRPGMLDGALTQDANGKWRSNRKVGFGEFGLISSGSYDNFSWWLDASLAGADSGIGMLEGIYYFNDLAKVRFGRVQNNVGYGMTMMSHRPLAYGWNDAAQMAGGTMLMMGDGISITGTTNGDSGVGTSYTLSAFTYGKNFDQNNNQSTAFYGRVAQEIMGNHIIGVYGYSARNYSSDAFGGESSMLMAMGTPGSTTATAMQFRDVTRYGVDFAINYGEPLQVYGAFTFGKQKTFGSSQTLNVKAYTIAGEWIFADGWMLGAKWDYSRADAQATMPGLATVAHPKATQNATLFGLYQVSQNVQAVLSLPTADIS